MTKLIDEWCNKEYVHQQGNLIRTKNTKMLSVLSKQAERYWRQCHNRQHEDKALFSRALDETGTVNTALLTDSDNDSISSYAYK